MFHISLWLDHMKPALTNFEMEMINFKCLLDTQVEILSRLLNVQD
jgi:hypothetical protein